MVLLAKRGLPLLHCPLDEPVKSSMVVNHVGLFAVEAVHIVLMTFQQTRHRTRLVAMPMLPHTQYVHDNFRSKSIALL